MDSLFFLVSKLVWFVISPDSLLLILMVIACILLWRKKLRMGRWVLTATVGGFLIIALLPVGEWVLYPLERRFPADPELPRAIEGIIVLGGAENAQRSVAWQQVEVGEGAERQLAFLSLARQFPEARLVYTGGSGSLTNQDQPGADVARELLQAQGLDLTRVQFEQASRNTYENVIHSQQLLQPQPGETWVVITSAWHMPRAMGVFQKAEWPVIAYPVDHWTHRGNLLRLEWNLDDHLRDLTVGTKEWVGLFAYYLSGKTSRLLPHASKVSGQ